MTVDAWGKQMVKEQVGFRNGGAQRHTASFTIWPGADPVIGCLSQECPQNSKSLLDAISLSCGSTSADKVDLQAGREQAD